MALIEEEEIDRRYMLYELGVAINAAMSDKPQSALKKILKPPATVDPNTLHPMLRPAARTNGG